MDCIDWLQNKNFSFIDLNYDDDNYTFQISESDNKLVKISIDKEKKIEAIVTSDYIKNLNKDLLYSH
jgi:hypothetical protein